MGIAGTLQYDDHWLCIIQAFYMCGLQEGAAVDAARTIAILPSTSQGCSDFDGPSWVLYRYWLAQDPSFQDGAERPETPVPVKWSLSGVVSLLSEGYNRRGVRGATAFQVNVKFSM